MIIKVNQVGTVTGARETNKYAREHGIATAISHRSGETADAGIAHMGAAWGCSLIKAGVTGGERLAKLNELIRIEDAGDRLDAGELLMLAFSILVAGTDTTRSQLAASMQVLCDHPEQWALLQETPDLAIRAVEETMRHSPSMCSTVRSVAEDVAVGDYTFPAGAFILVNTYAANRDNAIYDDPTRFDITRDEPPPILTFGGGVHYCLGANLARLELAEALKILSQRIPAPRRTESVPWKPLLGLSGPTSLTIEFG
jgi:cytochrome P450